MDVKESRVRRGPLQRAALLTAVSTLTVALAACGTSGPSSAGPTASSKVPVAESGAPAGPASDTPFGAGCSTLPASGSGSVRGMAADPVAIAAAQNPALAGLAAAVARADLADSFNSQQNVTVLAPDNPAFAVLSQPTRDGLLADTAKLTRMLTHHVLEGRLTPGQLAGTHSTLANDTVTITGSGEKFDISGDQTLLGSRPATVVCGSIATANATVYIIDQVLTPRR